MQQLDPRTRKQLAAEILGFSPYVDSYGDVSSTLYQKHLQEGVLTLDLRPETPVFEFLTPERSYQ